MRAILEDVVPFLTKNEKYDIIFIEEKTEWREENEAVSFSKNRMATAENEARTSGFLLRLPIVSWVES